jgi:RNA polymerase sigma-70 factor, ECF subfamily
LALSARYLDRLVATISYQPDVTLYSNLGFADQRPSVAYELTGRWPLPLWGRQCERHLGFVGGGTLLRPLARAHSAAAMNQTTLSRYIPLGRCISVARMIGESLEHGEFGFDPGKSGPIASEQERELLCRVVAADRDAFRELYLRYHRRLARILTRLMHRYEDAEEVINDTLWIVRQRAGEFRNASRVSTWIMGIAYRHALNTLRRASSHERAMRLEFAESEAIASDSTQALEQRQLLDSGLAQLPLEQRLVLEFTYYFDYLCEEIAEIMECPVNTVKTRIFHARRKLRTILAGSALGMENGHE